MDYGVMDQIIREKNKEIQLLATIVQQLLTIIEEGYTCSTDKLKEIRESLDRYKIVGE